MLIQRYHEILRSFGMEDMQFSVFYSTPVGIRFDIGDGIEVASPSAVEHCLTRAKTILNALPVAPDILAIQLYYMDEAVLRDDIRAVLSATGLPYPPEIEKKEIVMDGDNVQVAVLCWNIPQTVFSQDKLLKEIIISDLGGEHLLTASVFWLCSRNNTMFHLYDNRGADLVAAEKSTLSDLYRQFNKWILAYDRQRIEQLFDA